MLMKLDLICFDFDQSLISLEHHSKENGETIGSFTTNNFFLNKEKSLKIIACIVSYFLKITKYIVHTFLF